MAAAVPNTGDTVTQRLAGVAGQPLDGAVTGSWAGGSEAAFPDRMVATAQLRHGAWLKFCVCGLRQSSVVPQQTAKSYREEAILSTQVL